MRALHGCVGGKGRQVKVEERRVSVIHPYSSASCVISNPLNETHLRRRLPFGALVTLLRPRALGPLGRLAPTLQLLVACFPRGRRRFQVRSLGAVLVLHGWTLFVAVVFSDARVRPVHAAAALLCAHGATVDEHLLFTVLFTVLIWMFVRCLTDTKNRSEEIEDMNKIIKTVGKFKTCPRFPPSVSTQQ